MTTAEAIERTQRKADRVADDLLRRIVIGELEVGSVLPKEEALAAHYDVNRSVVREAVKLLEVHRLVRPVRRRGTVVLDPMASMSPEVLRAMLSPNDGRVDPDVLADFLEVRSALDVQMTMLAAQRRTEADLAALDRAVVTLGAALHDRVRYDREALQFPRLIARATHNRVFEMLVWWHQTVAVELASIFGVVRPANDAHLQGITLLVELIRKREVEQVRTLVTAFHAWATPRMLAAAALSSGAPLSDVMEGGRR